MRRWWLIVACLSACQGPTIHADLDGDGFCVAPGEVWDAKDHTCEGARGFGDCNDASADISPSADDLCDDGIDNDCDGTVDEVTTRDLDGDGSLGASCPGVGEDCDDNDAAVWPGADEICDGLDNDCNELIDDGLPEVEYFVDADGDGFGEQGSQGVFSCEPVDGAVDNALDCDDLTSDRSPAVGDSCNLIDDNCDGEVDENSDGRATFYADLDGDGYGSATGDTVDGCREAEEPGWSLDPRDCNDGDRNIRPDQLDATCDGVDDNCNTAVDEDAGQQDYFEDADNDGYGAGTPTRACPALAPVGWVTEDGDCDDADGEVSPGVSIDPCNGEDDDCDEETDEDAPQNLYFIDGDGDGFGAGPELFTCFDIDSVDRAVEEDGDCDDTDTEISPDGTDDDCDGVDQNCDGREPVCPADAFWVAASRAAGIMDLGESIPTSLSTCATDESWIARGGYDQNTDYGDTIVIPDWTRVHVAWEASHVDHVDIPQLGLFDLPNVGGIDLSSIDESFELFLEYEEEVLASVEILSHEVGPEPGDPPYCYLVPHPLGLFPLGPSDAVAMPAPALACEPDPLNASIPFDGTCCPVIESVPQPWSTSVDDGDHVLEFYASGAPAAGQIYRTYGYPTRMPIDSFLTLVWDPVQQWDIWYRVGLAWSDPSEDACQLSSHTSTSSPWFLDAAVDFWNFGPANNVDPRFPNRTIGQTTGGVRVVPYVDVFLPEPLDGGAALAIIEPRLVCCGGSCGPMAGPGSCPYDYDGDGAGTWCGIPQTPDAWDCDENDAGVYPRAVSPTADHCNHPAWWANKCGTTPPPP